jgi:hypothetical protein
MTRSLTLSRRRARPAATVLSLAVAGASLGAAAIHFAVVPEHLEEWPAAGLFFVVLAIFQAAWAVAYLWRPSRWAIAVGILANLATAALWLVSRTIGLPFSPEPWVPEEIGLLDVVASALELFLVVGLLVAARRSRRA